MFFINPPFGNYISLPYTVPIHGSFTLQERKGLIYQIAKTLRFSFHRNGWVNKIGLRNKGIDWALQNVPNNHIISIAILHETEVSKFIEKIPKNRDIEINISCPNTDKKMICKNIEKFLNPEREWCIIKVSPVTTNNELKLFYELGFRQFHCCNTIPVKEGGLSGSSIIPYTNEKINYIKNHLPNSTIIAGGGISSWRDVENYKKIGANHFGVSSICFNFPKFIFLYFNYLKNDIISR